MALKKCKDCGDNVSESAKVCPHCGAPMKRRDMISSLARLSIIVFLIIPLGVGIFTVVYESETKKPAVLDQPAQQNTQSQIANETGTHDDLSLFISRYGTPDLEQSSENEVPRPPIVTKWLIYKKENIRAVYVPDTPIGSSPPYKKWKQVGFQNHKTNEVIGPEEVVKLMTHCDRTDVR